jgi:malonyl CoA-acyl carrier protein transacylase
MNVSKSMMKVDLAKTLGKQYAEMAEAAEKDRLRQEGARDALREAAKAVGNLGVKLDEALEAGELTQDMLRDPKQVEIFIKRWNKRSVGALDNLATRAEIAMQVVSGRIKGLRAAEEVVQKAAQVEVDRLAELQRQIDSGEVTVESVTSYEAPPSLKHQREDEVAREATSNAAPEPASEGTRPPAKTSAAKAPTKRPKKKPVPRTGTASKKG